MKTDDYAAARLAKLRAKMRELRLDAMLTLDPANLRWLTAWRGVFDDEAAHLALITAGKIYVHTDSRYNEAMQAKTGGSKIEWQISSEAISHFKFAAKTLARSRKTQLHIGYESNIRLDLYKSMKKQLAAAAGARIKIKLVETDGLFASLRAVKDAEEVRLLRKAQTITDAAFAQLLTWIKPGASELEIANRLEYELRQGGAEGLAFASIVASGANSALPHARPSQRKLRNGDFLTLDFGARYQDYCADMTRTLVIGQATAKQRQIYNAVLQAQAAAQAGIKAGVTGKQAYALANDVLKAAGLDKQFTHSLGHGVGINVHEQPSLSLLNADPLVVGNIVTVEPGVYIPGFGGVRIEDFGLVGEQGFKSFTKSPHKLIEVD